MFPFPSRFPCVIANAPVSVAMSQIALTQAELLGLVLESLLFGEPRLPISTRCVIDQLNDGR